MPNTARRKCYDAINQSVRDGFARYYAEFPERLGDERAKDALEWALRGVARIYGILDQYDITERSGGKASAPPAGTRKEGTGA